MQSFIRLFVFVTLFSQFQKNFSCIPVSPVKTAAVNLCSNEKTTFIRKKAILLSKTSRNLSVCLIMFNFTF